MSHTDDVLAEIIAANERVCQARSELYTAKAVASALGKTYAEAVDNLTLTIGGAGRESTTPLFDQAEADAAAAAADQAEPGQEEPPEPDYFPPFDQAEAGRGGPTEPDQAEPPRRPRGRKPGRKSTKKHRKTRRK